MVSVFAILVVIAGFWEVWTIRAFLLGQSLWLPEVGLSWWIGFLANTSLIIWMLVDCLARPLKSGGRNRWIAAIIFLGVVGCAGYFTLVKMKKHQEGLDLVI